MIPVSAMLQRLCSLTRFLYQKLSLLFFSVLILCTCISRFSLSKAFDRLAMDVFSDHDYNLCFLDSCPLLCCQRRSLYQEDKHDIRNERVYLVPYSWWKEAQGDAEGIEGVMFRVLTNSDFDSDIVLHLREGDDRDESKNSKAASSGRQYALVYEWMWLRALRRFNDFSDAVKYFGNNFCEEDCLPDLFPLKACISVSLETNSLVLKISQEENLPDYYKKACNIFSSEHNPVHIIDFTGQTTQFFVNEKLNVTDDSPEQSGKDVSLKLQVQVQSHSCMAIDSLGLTGLQNLGNTCFMNSAIQCLIHTPKLVDFFLGDYKKEINYENPSGMKGELALTFGDLLRRLWMPGARSVAPRMFKKKLSDFASQFSGCSQHDSQELLAFLLDGLHQDLNRVKRKPDHEVKGADGHPEEEVAEKHWRNHLAQNDSIIGQLRSTLVCSDCKKISITYDPFMCLSLPIPCTAMTRTMALTVLSTDGITLPSTFIVTVPTYGTLKDLTESLSVACSLRDDETILLAEICKGRILRLLKDPHDSLVHIKDEDKFVAYRLQSDNEAGHTVVFMHRRVEKLYRFGKEFRVERLFGTPIVSVYNPSCGNDIRTEFLKLISPFLMHDKYDDPDDLDDKRFEDNELSDASSYDDFEFYFSPMEVLANRRIRMNIPLPNTRFLGKLEVVVFWSNKMINMYNIRLLSSLPEDFSITTQDESVSVYECLEAFLKEEPLGTENMWYCPSCEKYQQATKKIDLWRLPEILVLHLKRFSLSRNSSNKLESFVDFPIDNLDVSTYVASQNSHSSNRYVLYAVSCHYGDLEGGHYTAFVRYGDKRWFKFDDSSVELAREEMTKTCAAYVLFYKRV